MGTAIICLILIAICVFAVISYSKKLKNGCCGTGGDVESKIKPQDKDRTHYPNHYIIEIEGMSCKNCATRIENAFNKQEGMLAEVNLKKKLADVYTKEPADEHELRRIVVRAGYEVVSEEKID